MTSFILLLMPSFSFRVFAVLDCTQKKQLHFFGSRPNWAHFEGFDGNIPSKEHQIELIFWPQVVLIDVQMPFKAFWNLIFTETGHTQNLSFWSNFDYSLPPEDGGNQK